MLPLELIGNAPKYQLIVNAIKRAIEQGELTAGDKLPSVAELCKEQKISRDTAFKVYTHLKNDNTIMAIPNKGYYVADSNQRVLLLLDTFKAYKEVLHGAFFKELHTENRVDLNFHHYNIDHFKRVIADGAGLYSRYIIMPFQADGVEKILDLIPDNKLLIIDWDTNNSATNKIVQDFDNSLCNALETLNDKIGKYSKLIYIYPPFTYHPAVSKEAFRRFCSLNRIDGEIEEIKIEDITIEKDSAYLTVSDRVLGELLEQCNSSNLEPGRDIGIISYNETPMKKFVYKGITVISVDFRELGKAAAHFANSGEPVQRSIKTTVIVRDSL